MCGLMMRPTGCLMTDNYTMSENASPRSAGPSIKEIVDITVEAFGERQKAEKLPRGRPSDYTQEWADAICFLIGEGHSLLEICEQPNTPDTTTVYRWLNKHEDFRLKYRSARLEQADTLFDKAERIAARATPENVQVAKLQVDVIKWQTARLHPKKYGDRLDVNPDEDRPMNVSTSAKDDTTRAKAMAALLARRRANSNG